VYLLDGGADEPTTPPVFMAFDYMFARGRDLHGRPLSYRREALEEIVGDGHHVYGARRLDQHGLNAWAEVKQRGYEGLVAKNEQSLYKGGPTRSWIKCKIRRESRSSSLIDVPLAGTCSWLLAMRQGRRFIYVGRAELGATTAVHQSHPEAVRS